MKILLVFATRLEMKGLSPYLELVKKGGKNFSTYRLGKRPVDILITGVGLPYTIFGLSHLLHGISYDLAINAGIAGSFKGKFKIGQVLDVKEDCFADLGIQDHNHFETLFEAGFMEKDTFPFEGGKVKKTHFHENKALDKLAKVSGVTANTAHGATQAIEGLRQKFNPDVESMEGAGFFFVCRMMGVPALQVRAVSNQVGPRDVEKWDIPMATSNLARVLVDIINLCP